MARLLRLGHRGARARKSIPENTIASFDQALAEGSHGFEFDVRLSADAEPVICHDPAHGAIEIQKARAADLPGLCTLAQVLERYHQRAFLDMELKVPGLEQITLNFLRKFPVQRGFVVSSFLPEVLKTLRDLDPSLPLGLIAETRPQLQLWTKLPVSFVIPQFNLLTAELAQELKSEGKRILPWTVNHPDDMKKMADLGVDGLISDDPALLRQTLPD